jgi:hypothetical protein
MPDRWLQMWTIHLGGISMKKPSKWIMLDQLHIDIYIKSDMPAKDRRSLIKAINEADLAQPIQGLVITRMEGWPAKWKDIQVRITK